VANRITTATGLCITTGISTGRNCIAYNSLADWFVNSQNRSGKKPVMSRLRDLSPDDLPGAHNDFGDVNDDKGKGDDDIFI